MSTTPTPPGDRRRRWPTVLAVAVAVVVVVVVAWLLVTRALLGDDAGSGAASGGPTPVPTPSAPVTAEPATGTTAPSAEPTVSPPPASEGPSPDGAQVTLWFAGEHPDTVQNPALYPEPTEVAAGTDPVQAAVDALLRTVPTDPDYGNAYWDEASESSGRSPATATVSQGADGTTVDLSADAFDVGVGSAYAELGVQQLVSTVLTNGGTAPVRLTVDGAPGAEVWGVLALEPAYEVDEQVWTSASVVSVRHGEQVTSPVTLSGLGFGYEGELDVLVLDEATGDVVQETFVPLSAGQALSEAGEPVRSKYSIDLELDPGTYRLVVADGNASSEGPRWVSYDDKVVTVG